MPDNTNSESTIENIRIDTLKSDAESTLLDECSKIISNQSEEE